MSVTAYDRDPTEALVAAQQAVNRLDALWSRTRADSDVARLNAAAGSGPVAVDPDTAALLEKANAAALESGMAFDPVLAPVMDAWGFGATESETTAVHRVPEQAELDALLPLTRDLPVVEGDTAALSMAGQAVDLGAIAKGAAADYVVAALTEHGVDSAIIALGGNITALGTKPDGSPFRVYVRDPQGEGEDYLCLMSLPAGRTCSTSGGYERYFEADGQIYHHIIDPADGYPARSGLLSVTVAPLGDGGGGGPGPGRRLVHRPLCPGGGGGHRPLEERRGDRGRHGPHPGDGGGPRVHHPGSGEGPGDPGRGGGLHL